MKKLLFLVIILMLANTSANAIVIGDTIQGTISNTSYNWSSTVATVSAEVEFSAVFTNLTMLADFSADTDTVTLSYENTSQWPNITVGALSFFFFDFNLPDEITGLTELVNDFPDQGSFATFFNADSIQIDVPMTNTNPGDLFSSTFRVDTAPAPVPEPSTILLLGSGLLGLGWYGRKRKKA